MKKKRHPMLPDVMCWNEYCPHYFHGIRRHCAICEITEEDPDGFVSGCRGKIRRDKDLKHVVQGSCGVNVIDEKARAIIRNLPE